MVKHVDALRERHVAGSSAPGVGVAARTEPIAARADGWLVCAGCANFVAEGRARIEVAGAHAHSFINPEGAIYRIGCFASAPGAVPWGEPSAHWTWFSGFEWQVVGCRRCGTHLGWSYGAEGTSFAALILDRIVEVPAAGPNLS